MKVVFKSSQSSLSELTPHGYWQNLLRWVVGPVLNERNLFSTIGRAMIIFTVSHNGPIWTQSREKS